MTITKITDKTPGCFGTMCPLHARCARYALVEKVPIDQVIATCSTGGEERPLFVAVEKDAA